MNPDAQQLWRAPRWALAVLLAVPVLGEALKPSTLAFSLAVMAVVMLGKRMPVRTPKEMKA